VRVAAIARGAAGIPAGATAPGRRDLVLTRRRAGRGRRLDRSANRESRRERGLNGTEEIATDVREVEARAGRQGTASAQAGAKASSTDREGGGPHGRRRLRDRRAAGRPRYRGRGRPGPGADAVPERAVEH